MSTTTRPTADTPALWPPEGPLKSSGAFRLTQKELSERKVTDQKWFIRIGCV